MRKYCIVFIMLLLLVAPVIAQDDGDDAPTIDEQIDLIERNTETLRGLTAQEDVPILFPSREETYEFLIGEFDAFYTEETIAELMAFYVAFDFLPGDFDIREVVLELYGQQVAGYYDPASGAMHVVTNDGEVPSGRLLLLDRITYSHEYVHALQDQYFDLAAYQETIEAETTSFDKALAYQALVEGDASFVMNEYTRQVTEANPVAAMIELGIGALDAGNLFMPEGTPAIFEAELLFPYLRGERFVAALYADGGWDTVNAAYDALPQSTEHILHPQTYLDGDMPQAVDLPVNELEGYELAVSDSMGEFYLREWFETQDIDSDSVDLAATGWGGDAVHIYQNAEGDLAWELRLAWDSSDDADEFMMVIQDFIDLRIPEATRPMGAVACWSGAVSMCINAVDETTVDVTFGQTIEIANDLLN